MVLMTPVKSFMVNDIGETKKLICLRNKLKIVIEKCSKDAQIWFHDIYGAKKHLNVRLDLHVAAT